jgi:hypothetical protein
MVRQPPAEGTERNPGCERSNPDKEKHQRLRIPIPFAQGASRRNSGTDRHPAHDADGGRHYRADRDRP